jgi:hypothetical protein
MKVKNVINKAKDTTVELYEDGRPVYRSIPAYRVRGKIPFGDLPVLELAAGFHEGRSTIIIHTEGIMKK